MYGKMYGKRADGLSGLPPQTVRVFPEASGDSAPVIGPLSALGVRLGSRTLARHVPCAFNGPPPGSRR